MTISISGINNIPQTTSFELEGSFLFDQSYRDTEFGFNGLGEITYLRTYSRLKSDGTKEEWWETVKRVVEGTYSIQKRHITQNGLHWDDEKSQKSAQKMYDYIFSMKFLPPGRGLWAMGTDIIEKRGLFSALNNCAFVSTEDLLNDPVSPFTFMMDGSMLGVGVGFDTKGAGKIRVLKPLNTEFTFIIPDTREGWVRALELLLSSYFDGEFNKYMPHPYNEREPFTMRFDYTLIRQYGERLETFGGLASGYEPLKVMLECIRDILNIRAGSGEFGMTDDYLTETDIADIMNMIGVCVVAGNVRRTAQIAFGSSDEFINLKNYKINSRRQAFGWASNNSYFATIGDDYTKPAEMTQYNGEPGYFWLENAQKYGRMGRNAGERLGVDYRATGGNPCLEQTLESYEMCCLVETFPMRCDSFEEYQDVLKYAYLYAKTVTLGKTHWEKTNEVMLRNRRIGTSISGVAQFIESRGVAELKTWLDAGYKAIEMYDTIYSEWFKVPKSIKITSVKPSGTVSLLAGATPGVHYPESRYYLRRITISKDDPLVGTIKALGLTVEDHLMSDGKGNWHPSDKTVQAVFPVDSGVDNVRPSMWKQLEIAAFMQEWWADNQVSVTVSFDLETEGSQIKEALDIYQFRLKGVSFLPRTDLSSIYPQLPYEAITKEDYYDRKMIQDTIVKRGYHIKDVSAFDDAFQDAIAEKFCSNDTCELSFAEQEAIHKENPVVKQAMDLLIESAGTDEI